MTFRDYFTGTVFVLLLLCGPINHSWPSWFAIRISYLMLIPLVIWLIIGWIWNYWQPEVKTEIVLKRLLSGIIVISLLTLAYFLGVSKTHIGNTQWIQTRDGWEDVGDDIVLQGPDWGSVIIIIIIALLFLWFGVFRKGPKDVK
jgi:hypothetical protein